MKKTGIDIVDEQPGKPYRRKGTVRRISGMTTDIHQRGLPQNFGVFGFLVIAFSYIVSGQKLALEPKS